MSLNIAVFASHGGSDLQAIIDACKSGLVDAKVCAVISNNGDSMALERARRKSIDSFHLSLKTAGTQEALEQELLGVLTAHEADMIFLAGYLKKLGEAVVQKYENRIFNIHPALLPKYGGAGMYGSHVHKAVIEAGENITGVTVHRADADYDTGEIVAQTMVEVLSDDTPESLAARVLEREHTFLVEVIGEIISGKIRLGT
jgi:phosphoribosylglycinamide formyltransferase-1